MSKSADAFRTISEVAEWLDTPAHVLRFWESKFTQVKPVKRAGGRRYYRPADMRLLGGIKKLLHEDGMTIKGVQKILREQGIKHVSSLCALSVGDEDDFEDAVLQEVPASEPVDTVVPFAKPTPPADPEPEEAVAEAVAPEDAEPEIIPQADVAEADSLAVEDTEMAEDVATAADLNAPEVVAEMVEPEAAEPEQAEDAAAPTAESPETEAVEAPEPEPEPETAQEPEPEPEPESAAPAEDPTPVSPLPAFLQRSMSDRIEAETVRTAEPETKPESAAPAEPDPGCLTHLARIRRLSTAQAEQIRPIVERLRSRLG